MNKIYDKDLYKILNIDSDADAAEIRAAYRKLARIYHPDISESEESLNAFKEIRQAYEILSDEEKKKLYDIKHGLNTKKNSEENIQITEKDTNNNEVKTENITENIKGKEKTLAQIFGEIIEGIFVRRKKSQNNFNTKSDYDIYANVTISTKEAILGTSRIINVMQTKVCTNCEGKKFINESLCPLCKGSGEISNHKRINIKIPQNTKDGDKIKIEGAGNQNEKGDKAGDLYLIVSIDEKSLFSVKDDIVYMDLPISTYEAALGANIEIPTFYENITIKIPPNTSSGQKFRLKGQGIYMKDMGVNGDMIVTVIIKLPQKFSDKEIEIYKSLRDNSTVNVREGLNPGD